MITKQDSFIIQIYDVIIILYVYVYNTEVKGQTTP